VICAECGQPLRKRLNSHRRYCDGRCLGRAAYAKKTAKAIEARMATIAAWQRWQRNRIAA